MKFYLFLLFLLSSLTSLGQSVILTGSVTANDQPLPFVNIYVEESRLGTTTNEKGQYMLKLPIGHHNLIVQAIGYKTQEHHLDALSEEKQTLNFSLQEDVTGLDQVVISASRSGQLRHTAPVIVSVTSSKDLKATQSISLSEGLNFQPGLRMETNCQNCGYSQVRMNGLDGAYSQILIDSRPVFSALNGVYGLDQIPANSIERIEVVRGGGSALYGSNAIAGTINIITKVPSENNFEVAGNFAVLHSGSIDKALTLNGTILLEDFQGGLNVYGMNRDRNSYDHNGDGYTEITKLKNNTMGFKTFLQPNKRSEVKVDFHAIQEFRRGGNHLNLKPFESDITEQIESEVIGGGLTYEAYTPSKNFRYSGYATAQFSQNDNFYGGKAETYQESLKGYGNSLDHTYVLGGQGTYKQEKFLDAPTTLTFGAEFKNNLMKDRKPGYNARIDQNLNILGIYAQQEWQATKKLKVLGGARADYHNAADENFVFNPRLNLLYSPNDQIQFRTSYAKGFRAPQVFTEDIHARIAAGEISLVRLAENLESETSHSFLASVEWSKLTLDENYRFTLETFFTRLEKPFILERVSETLFEKRNGKGANVLGMNMDMVFAPNPDWVLQLGGTLQKAKYDSPVQFSEDPQVPLENARNFFKSPNIYGNFILTYAPVRKWQNNLSGVYTGRMYVPHLAGYIDKDRLEKTQDFLEVNFKTAYIFKLLNSYQMEINLGVQNMLNAYQNDFDRSVNRDANYVYGPSRPRSFFVGLKLGNKIIQ